VIGSQRDSHDLTKKGSSFKKTDQLSQKPIGFQKRCWASEKSDRPSKRTVEVKCQIDGDLKQWRFCPNWREWRMLVYLEDRMSETEMDLAEETFSVSVKLTKNRMQTDWTKFPSFKSFTIMKI
jgi:hypothetical protein